MIGNIIAGITSYVTPPFSPSDLTGLKAWYDAADTATITVSGTAVTQWNDKSTSGYNLTQGTAVNRPTSGVTTLNSKNVITFDGGDALVNTTKANWTWLHNGDDYLMVAAVKFTATSNPNTLNILFDTHNVDTSLLGASFFFDDRSGSSQTDALRHRVGVNVVSNDQQNALPTPNDYEVIGLLADPNNATAANRSYITFDGTTWNNNTDSGSVSASNANQNFHLGNFSGLTLGVNGGIAEVVFVVGADATTANRTKLIDYMKDKWAI